MSGYVDESSENTAAEPWQDNEIRPPPARILDISGIEHGGTETTTRNFGPAFYRDICSISDSIKTNATAT